MATGRREADMLIDRAVRALRNLPVSNGPPADVVEEVRLAGAVAASRSADLIDPATERARPALDAPSWSPIPVGTFSLLGAKLMCPRNLAAVAALAAVIFFMAQWVPFTSTASFAFAQVQEEVAKTKSVQYVMKNKTKTEGQKNEPEGETRVMILGTDRMREEVSAKWGTELDNNPHIDQHYTYITDFGRQREIILHPKQKTFRIPQRELPKDSKSPKASAILATAAASNFIKQRPAPDLFTLIRVPDESTKKLPAQIVGGQKCVGFYVEKTTNTPHGNSTQKWTYWVDPATKRPVQIERHWRRPSTEVSITTDGKSTETVKQMETSVVISNIVFDATLDPSLFSTDPPAGWTDLK